MAFQVDQKRRILKERPLYEVELDAEGIPRLEDWLLGLPEGSVLLVLRGRELYIETVRERSLLARGLALGYQMAHDRISETLDHLAPTWAGDTDDVEDPEDTRDLDLEVPVV